MRVPISGICVGFRIIKGPKDSSDFAKIFVVQPADKNHDASLIEIFVQDLGLIEFTLNNYSNGRLQWIDLYCSQIQNGRELVWLAERIYDLSPTPITVENDRRTISTASNEAN